MKVITFILILIVVVGIRLKIAENQYNTERLNITKESGTVVATGQCNKYTCAYSVKTSSGSTVNSTGDTPVSLGQIVYRECWEERVRGSRCYVDFRP